MLIPIYSEEGLRKELEKQFGLGFISGMELSNREFRNMLMLYQYVIGEINKSLLKSYELSRETQWRIKQLEEEVSVLKKAWDK